MQIILQEFLMFFKKNKTHADLANLKNIFPQLMFSRIKFFYSQLNEEYMITREYLLKEFRDFYDQQNETKIHKTKTSKKKKNNLVFKDFEWISPFGKEIKNLKNKSSNELTLIFSQIRSKIREYKKIYCLYSKCLSNSKRSNNYSDAANFMSLKKKAERTINQLSHKSKYIVFKKSKDLKFKSVDLHYLFLEEAEEILYIIFECLQYQMGHGSFEIVIITGKGKHSRGLPVLFPKIKDLMRRENHKVVSAKNGRIVASIKV